MPNWENPPKEIFKWTLGIIFMVLLLFYFIHFMIWIDFDKYGDTFSLLGAIFALISIFVMMGIAGQCADAISERIFEGRWKS